MELVFAGWILPILQNYISEIVLDGNEGLLKKWKHKKFLKRLNKEIIDFCNRNECLYIDSGAFEYFVRETDFLKKIVDRAVSVEIKESDKAFWSAWTKKARDIANAEGVAFSNNEEHIVKELCVLIDNHVRSYYNNKLSEEQKVIVANHLRAFAKINETLIDLKDGINEENKNQTEVLLNAIKGINVIGNSEAELLSKILIANIWEGRIKEFEELASVVKDKSSDLKNLYECINNIFITNTGFKATDNLEKIENSTIRDNVIRAIAPILFLNHISIVKLSDFVTGSSLKTIVSSMESGDWGQVFTKSVTEKSGVEVHNFELIRSYYMRRRGL